MSEAESEGLGAGVRADAPDLPSHPVELGRVLGDYRLLAHLGRGGMADVYLAEELEAGEPRAGAARVVVKEVLPRLIDDPAFSRGLMAEAELSLHLRHENIVHTIELGDEEDLPFIVMEYVPGLDLHQLLRALTSSRQGLHAAYAFHIVVRILRGLGAAHGASDEDGRPLGVVHCDVSPANVLLGVDGSVKVCDFGVAKADVQRFSPADAGFGESEEWALDDDTAPGHVAGKWRYLAPEQAAGRRFDARADVFAAGVLLWELCAGRPILRAPRDTPHEELLRLAAERQSRPLPVSGFPEQAWLQSILDRALSREPRDRYSNAFDFADALCGYLRGNGMEVSQEAFGAYIRNVCDTIHRPAWPLHSEDERAITDDGEVGPSTAEEDLAPASSDSVELTLRSLKTGKEVEPSDAAIRPPRKVPGGSGTLPSDMREAGSVPSFDDPIEATRLDAPDSDEHTGMLESFEADESDDSTRVQPAGKIAEFVRRAEAEAAAAAEAARPSDAPPSDEAEGIDEQTHYALERAQARAAATRLENAGASGVRAPTPEPPPRFSEAPEPPPKVIDASAAREPSSRERTSRALVMLALVGLVVLALTYYLLTS